MATRKRSAPSVDFRLRAIFTSYPRVHSPRLYGGGYDVGMIESYCGDIGQPLSPSDARELVPFFRYHRDGLADEALLLLNFYKGVQIIFDAEVTKVEESSIAVKAHPFQTVAIRNDGKTVLKSIEIHGDLLADASFPDPEDQETIVLSGFRPVQVLAENRQALRVELAEPVRSFVSHKASRLTGAMLDLTPGSVAILLPKNDILKTGYRVRINAALPHAPGTLEATHIDVGGDVVKVVRGTGASDLHIFTFLADLAQEQRISAFIGRRQMEILGEIKRLAGMT